MFTSPGDRAGRKRFLGLQFWIEGRSIDPPNVTIPTVSWTINDTSAIVDAAVVPKGSGGSFLLSIPDNVVLGGNKRGQWAVDMQLRRTTNTMVAGADYSALIAGRNNTVVPSATPLYAGCFVGLSNQITGIGSASATGSVVLGGTLNVVTDSGGTNGAGILAGSSNTVTVASAKDGQAIIGSFSSAATGKNAAVLGGRENSAVADYGSCMGMQAKTRGCVASFAHGADSGTTGSGQYGRYVLNRTSIDATTIALTQNRNASSALNQVGPIPTGFVFAYSGVIAANVLTASAGASWRLDGSVRNQGGTLSICTGSTVTNTSQDGALATATVSVTVDNTNKCLLINITGVAATTILWGGFVETMEVAP